MGREQVRALRQVHPACNHYANSFEGEGKQAVYKVNYHHCTMCQHCLKVCPAGAITLDSHDYADFQTAWPFGTKTVLDTFEPATPITSTCSPPSPPFAIAGA